MGRFRVKGISGTLARIDLCDKGVWIGNITLQYPMIIRIGA